MNTTNSLNHKSHGAPRGLAARWNCLICVIVLSLLRVSCDGNSYPADFISTRTTPSYGGTIRGGGIVSPPGSAQTLTATPNVGYAFENWTDAAGNVVSTSASFSYTLAQGNFVSLLAHFTLIGGGGGDWRALSVTVSPDTVQAAPGDDFGYVATVRDGWGEPVFNASVFLDKPASWPAPPSAILEFYLTISGDGLVNGTDGYGQFTPGRNVPPGTAAGTYTVSISASKKGYTSAATSAEIKIVDTIPTRLPVVTWLPDDNSGSMNFGSVPVGNSAVRTMVIRNLGNSTLTVNSIDFPDRFTGNWPGGTIAAGGSQQVEVTFTPLTTNTFGRYVTVNSDKTSGRFWGYDWAHVSGTGIPGPGGTAAEGPGGGGTGGPGAGAPAARGGSPGAGGADQEGPSIPEPQRLRALATYYHKYFSSRGDYGNAGFYFNLYRGLALKAANEAEGKGMVGLGYYYVYLGNAYYEQLGRKGYLASAWYYRFYYYGVGKYYFKLAKNDSAGAMAAYNNYADVAARWRTVLNSVGFW